MAEILGIGVTHYPPLIFPDEDMAAPLKYFLHSPHIPEQYKRTSSTHPRPAHGGVLSWGRP